MTTPPKDNNEHGDDHEFIEFLFTPKDRPDGSKPTDEYEERRLKWLNELTEQYAQESGLVPIPKGTQPPEPTKKTERSADIVQRSNIKMPEADKEVRNTIERYRQLPNGEIKASRYRLGVLDDLGESVKALAKSPGQAVDLAKVIAGSGVRIGLWVTKHFKAAVSVGGSEPDGAESAESDSETQE